MLTVSVRSYEPASKIKSRHTSSSKKHNSNGYVSPIGGLSMLGDAAAKEDKCGDWRAVGCHESNDACGGVKKGFYHSQLSPVAKILLVEHAGILKMIEMSLLGAIVFSICFAVTAGL